MTRQSHPETRDGAYLAIAVVATLLILVAMLLLATVELLRRRSLRLRGVSS